MKKANLQPLKGFRDFLPEEAKKKEFVTNTLKKVFSSYGFEPLETPTLEYTEILFKKYGSEAEKLIYQFKDKGGRDVGLRYDLTIPLARVVASNQNLIFPLKRYQIQPVWRADKPQAGRFREFWQADIDTLGVKNILSDAEIVACAFEVMEKLGFNNYQMLVNDRQIFQDYNLSLKAIVELDKKEKEGEKPFLQQLINEGQTAKEAQAILAKISQAKKTQPLEELFSLLKNKPLFFEPTLARGLDYYTGLIFELRVKSYGYLSVGAGGRYNNLIKQITGRDLPAVGFSFGLDRLMEAMKQQNLFKKMPATNQVLVTVFSKEYLEKSLELTMILRRNRVEAEVYLNPEDKLDKQIKYADKKGLRYVVILGPDELKRDEATIKDLSNGRQITIALNKINQFFGL